MNVQVFGKSKCFDTRKAQRFFKERGVDFQDIDLPRYGLSKGELNSVMSAVGGLDKLIDENNPDSAMVIYLAGNDAKIKKLLENPSIFRTPIVRNGNLATVGHKPDVWAQWIKDNKGE